VFAPSVGVRPPVIRREERRRRLLLLGIVAALLLAITPVVGHHVLGAVPWLSAEQHHFGLLCLVALHQLLEPIHWVAHWLLYAGAVYVVFERGGVVWRHRNAMRALRQLRVSPQSALGRAAVEAGLRLEQLRTVRGLPMPAFTSGWITVRVVVAADLHERLTHDELVAVLAHEEVHVRRRDPFRLFALRTLASLLFWLPVLRRLAADLEDEVEITADDQVPPQLALSLASAVLKLGGGAAPIAATVGFQRADLLPRRIRRLAGEDATPVTHTSMRSLAVASVALVLAWTSGLMVLHPLNDAAGEAVHSPAHCDHPLTSPWRHLFCRGWTLGEGQRDCPHEDPPVPNGVRS
jgi:Zn-dependent protease with chaperone function